MKVTTTTINNILYVEAEGYSKVVVGAPPSEILPNSRQKDVKNTQPKIPIKVADKVKEIIQSSDTIDIKTIRKIANNINGSVIPALEFDSFLSTIGYQSVFGNIVPIKDRGLPC